MKRKWKRMTAAEALAILQADPEWVRKNEEREAQRKAIEIRFRAEEAPILADLAQAGYTIESVWDLVNTRAKYPQAIPVLLKHLAREYHPRILEGIARALTVPEARGPGAWFILEALKRQPKDVLPHGQPRWALANALTVIADSSMVAELQNLIADDEYADVRERLTAALKKARSKKTPVAQTRN